MLQKELMQGRQLHLSTESHGSTSGCWTIAANTIDQTSIIYSVGVGSEITFDLSLIARYGVTVHAFDPTPRSIAWIEKQALPDKFMFHSIGVADYDGEALFHPPQNPTFVSYSLVSEKIIKSGSDTVSAPVHAPVYRLSSIMEQLRHPKIDLLKLDIEGAEYSVIEDLLDQSLPVNQILIEFHHRFSSIGVGKTREAIHLLNEAGYRIFHVSDLGEEYSFLKSS